MNNRILLLLVSAFLANNAQATDANMLGPDAAERRYAEDRKLCADESSSSLRMQCLRDAKAEYDKAVLSPPARAAAGAPSVAASCPGCGKVTAVRLVEKQGEGSATGMVAGGLAGALLGNQIGKGGTRDIATIAGAAGGAYAGRKIEGNMKTVKRWDVSVRFDNGDERNYSFDKDPGFTVGSPVIGSGNTIVSR